jgi:cytochrome c556
MHACSNYPKGLNMKKTLAVIFSSILLSSPVAFAEPAKSPKQAKDAIKYRQSALQLVKSNVGALGAMNKGAIPINAQTLETNSLRLKQLSLMLEDYFATDTSGFDFETAALSKIWKNQADFNKKIAGLTDAASNLNKVAKAGDEDQFKSAIGMVFRSCKSCHDDYKED